LLLYSSLLLPEVLCGTGELSRDGESPWDMYTQEPALLGRRSTSDSNGNFLFIQMFNIHRIIGNQFNSEITNQADNITEHKQHALQDLFFNFMLKTALAVCKIILIAFILPLNPFIFWA